jgi:hypothetical protein
MGIDGEHPGLFLHPVLGVDAANGGIIGLVNCIVRNPIERRVSEAKTARKRSSKPTKSALRTTRNPVAGFRVPKWPVTF